MINPRQRVGKHELHDYEGDCDRHVGRNRHRPLAGTTVVGFVQAAFVFVVVDDPEIEGDAQIQEGNHPGCATPLHDAVREFASATSESQVPLLASDLMLARSCR